MSYDTQNQETTTERFLALSQVSIALMGELDQQHLFQLIARTACDLTRATFAAFSLRPINEEGQPLVPAEGSLFHLVAVIGVTSEQEALFRRMPLGGEGLLAPIFRHGVPVLVADALTRIPLASHTPLSDVKDAAFAHGQFSSHEFPSPEIPAGHPQLRSFLGVPLLDHAGAVRGGLLLGHSEPDQFTQEDQAIMLILAGQAMVALENVRLREAALQAQKRTSYLEAIFEAMVDGVYVYDQHGHIVQMNSAARALLARTEQPGATARPPEERLAGATIIDIEGQHLTSDRWPVTRMLQGEQFTPEQAMELQMPTHDGEILYASTTGGPIRDTGGRIIGAVGIARDVTEHKQTEQALQKAERQSQEYAAQLEAILEAMPDILIVYDSEGRIIRTNAAGQRFMERFRFADVASSSVEKRAEQATLYTEQGEVLPFEEWPTSRTLRGETLTADNTIDLMQRDPQGNELFVSVTGGPLYDTQGQCWGGVFLAHDITERKHAERLREQQTQQLQLQASLIELAHDAIIVRDPHSVILSWNLGAEVLYGWTAQEAKGQVIHSLLKTYFPRSKEVMDHLLEQEGRWEGELVHTCRDGSTVVVASRRVLIRNPEGHPSAILEINRDVTAQRHLEYLERSARAEAESRLTLLQQLLGELPR